METMKKGNNWTAYYDPEKGRFYEHADKRNPGIYCADHDAGLNGCRYTFVC